MKTNIVTLFCAALFASIAVTEAGVVYLTIKPGDDPINVNSTDLIELVGHGSSGYIDYVYGQGETDYWRRSFPTVYSKIGYTVTGVTQIRMIEKSNPEHFQWATIKVISKDDLAVPTQASNVAVIPEDENGQYEVILESSTDMITWTPANAGTYGGTTTKRFFRTRIVKKTAP